jgi:ribokinase
MQTIRTGGARIVLDLDVANVQPGDDSLIAQADIVLFNRIGFEHYCAGRSSETVISGLLSGAAQIVVVTLGPDGCRVATTDGSFAVDGIAVEVVDVTGAGDTFGAALIHALNTTSDLRAAASFANAAAAQAVTALGARAGVATETDVVSFLHHHGLPLGSFPGSEGQSAPSTANERSVS